MLSCWGQKTAKTWSSPQSQALCQTPVGKRKGISKPLRIPLEASFRASGDTLLPVQTTDLQSQRRTPQGMDDDMDLATTYQQERKDNQAITRYQAYA